MINLFKRWRERLREKSDRDGECAYSPIDPDLETKIEILVRVLDENRQPCYDNQYHIMILKINGYKVSFEDEYRQKQQILLPGDSLVIKKDVCFTPEHDRIVDAKK